MADQHERDVQFLSTNVVVSLRIRGFKGLQKYYRICIKSSSTGRSHTSLVSGTLSAKLWARYSESRSKSKYENAVSCVSLRDESASPDLPAQHCFGFINQIERALLRKIISHDIGNSWVAVSTLYKLWYHTSQVTTELFADCFNESGILTAYCSADNLDSAFGSLRPWEVADKEIEGGAGNPPFDSDILAVLITRCEIGMRSNRPFCRCLLLPIGARYNVVNHISSLSSEGELLVSNPAGSVRFMNEMLLLSGDHVKPKPFIHQKVGLFIWCNREYMIRYPPPLDVEELYHAWLDYTLCSQEGLTVLKKCLSPSISS